MLKLRKYFAGILSTLYPKHCMVCNTFLEDAEIDLCMDCWRALPLIGSSHCEKCGAPLGKYSMPMQKCSRCDGELRNIKRVSAMFKYEETSKALIHELKFRRQKHVAYGLGKLFALHLKNEAFIKEVDLIVPVPLHWRREYARTFNQSEILASTVAKQLEIPYATNILARKRATNEQAKLSHVERRRNLIDAFSLSLVNKHKLRNKTILLIDDVMTTGTTMTECATTLKKGSPKLVYGAVLCRA